MGTKRSSNVSDMLVARRGGPANLRLAEYLPDADTIEALEELLEEAKQGNVIGIAFTAMLKQRQYWADTAGECHRNPTFTLGMVAVLNDILAARLRGE